MAIYLQRSPLDHLPQVNSPSQQMKAMFPSITRGPSSRAVVLKGTGHNPSFCLRHMHSCMLSPPERILPPGFRILGDGPPDQGFLLYSWQLILFQRDWEPKETAKSTFTWHKSKESSADPVSIATWRWNRQSPKKSHPKVRVRPKIGNGLGRED